MGISMIWQGRRRIAFNMMYDMIHIAIMGFNKTTFSCFFLCFKAQKNLCIPESQLSDGADCADQLKVSAQKRQRAYNAGISICRLHFINFQLSQHSQLVKASLSDVSTTSTQNKIITSLYNGVWIFLYGIWPTQVLSVATIVIISTELYLPVKHNQLN